MAILNTPETACYLANFGESAGVLADNGDYIINLKADKIGTHFDANLLIGNRIGFKSPLLTTPKGAVDSLGRGCSGTKFSRVNDKATFTFDGIPFNGRMP